VTIQWFPGHMTRARRQIEEKLKLIDVVIELLDARIPLASRNPMMDIIVREKPRLVVLNKFDLADPVVTEQWNQYFLRQGHRVLPIDSTTGKNLDQISPLCKQLLADKIAKQVRKGINPRAFRALIVGIPNVGKSTLINKLSGRSVAATGDRPGVTKAQQWIKVGSEMELLDTPGILWPKFEDQAVGYRLAVTGAIKEDILHIEDVAFYAIKYLIKHYPGRLQERYSIDQLPEDLTDSNQIVEVMEEIGRKRGCVVSGGRIDLEKTSGVILRELRAGKLDRISFETP
jgi:ribosome biogenesis GTPase A